MSYNDQMYCLNQPKVNVRSRGRARGAFTLLEMLLVLAVIGIVAYSSMSVFRLVQPAAGRAALQVLAAALDEARTTALRKAAPSPFFIRLTKNDLGQESIREFGVERQMGDGTVLLWRALPGQVVLLGRSLSSGGGRGVNVASFPMKALSSFDIPDLVEDGQQLVGGVVFGGDGQVVYPELDVGVKVNVFLLLVAQGADGRLDGEVKRHARIEISPGTGRAYLLE
jgi:prepilin-type N-terminal cleavage/methylation domain-containing protein